jgi:HlyD family secretion protein
MKKVIRIILILVIIGTLGFLGFYVFSKSNEPVEVFETDSTFMADIERKTVATGAINPRKEVEIKSQVSGVVEKLFVEAGDSVEAGQLIAKIQIIPDVVALNSAQAQLNEAMINFQNSEQEMERQRQLFSENVISQVDFNQIMLAYNLDKQQVEAAQNNLQVRCGLKPCSIHGGRNDTGCACEGRELRDRIKHLQRRNHNRIGGGYARNDF